MSDYFRKSVASRECLILIIYAAAMFPNQKMCTAIDDAILHFAERQVVYWDEMEWYLQHAPTLYVRGVMAITSCCDS